MFIKTSEVLNLMHFLSVFMRCNCHIINWKNVIFNNNGL